MGLIDANLIPLLLFVPLFGVMLIALVPKSDVRTTSQIATAILFLSFITLIRCATIIYNSKTGIDLPLIYPMFFPSGSLDSLYINNEQILMMFAAWFGAFIAVLCYGDYNVNYDRIFILATILLMAVTYTVIMLQSFATALALSSLSLWMVLLLVAYFGGPFRGTAILHSIVFLVSLDIAAYLALFLHIKGLAFLIMMPALSRLMLVLLAPWARKLIENCPPTINILLLSNVSISGGALLLKASHLDIIVKSTAELSPIILLIGSVSALFASLIAYSSQNRQQFCNSLFVLQTSLFAYSLDPALLASATICTSCALVITQNNRLFRQLGFFSLALIACVPGFGVGTLTWMTIAKLLKDKLMLDWISVPVLSCYAVAFLFICATWSMLNVMPASNLNPASPNGMPAKTENHDEYIAPSRHQLKLRFCFLLALVASWILPLWQIGYQA